MATYTTQVRSICEQFGGVQSSIDNTILNAIPSIFDFPFPIFDEKHKVVLEHKILKHFYFYEIGVETYARWKFLLNTRLNEIMPYYNQKYQTQWETVTRDFDTNMTTTSNGSSNSKTNTSNNNNVNTNTTDNMSSSSKTINSDYPQSSSVLMTGTYASTGTETDSSSSDNVNTSSNQQQTGNANTDSTLQNTTKAVGLSGRYLESDILKSYRDAIINIDLEIINELRSLFMIIW